MRLSPLRPVALACSLPLAACAATPPAVLLTQRTPLAVDYSAEVAGFDRIGELFPETTYEAPTQMGEAVALHAWLVTIEAGRASHTAGWQPGESHAFATPREEARRFLEAVDSTDGLNLLNEIDLTVFQGQPGHIAVINQTAYIERFQAEFQAQSSVADPVVAVARDGLVLSAVARSEGESVVVDLDLSVMELQHPFTELEVSLPGAFTPMTIQLPVGSLQRMQLQPSLAPDEVAVLMVHRAERSGQMLALLLAAENVGEIGL